MLFVCTSKDSVRVANKGRLGLMERAIGAATGVIRAADAVFVAAKEATASFRDILRPFFGEGVMVVDGRRFFRVMVDRMWPLA